MKVKYFIAVILTFVVLNNMLYANNLQKFYSLLGKWENKEKTIYLNCYEADDGQIIGVIIKKIAPCSFQDYPFKIYEKNNVVYVEFFNILPNLIDFSQLFKLDNANNNNYHFKISHENKDYLLLKMDEAELKIAIEHNQIELNLVGNIVEEDSNNKTIKELIKFEGVKVDTNKNKK